MYPGRNRTDNVIGGYHAGGLSRRQFVERMIALGVTGGMAQTLATVFGGSAYATSSRDLGAVKKAYDFVVVGGGSAGAAFAHRVVTTTDATVLVLEAGGPDDLPELHDPRRWMDTLQTRATKWFKTAKQPGTANREHYWPRGNVLGGSSSINTMIFARGHRSDYDGWAAQGCKGWNYRSVLPHFRAFEDFEEGPSEYRGAGGPLHISRPRGEKRHPGAAMFIEAAVAMGHPENTDFNAERMEGPAWVDINVRELRRQSSAAAFLKPVLDRSNLTVLTDASVTRVLFDRGRCVGVEYLHAGQPALVGADHEVLLAAGAIDSPRLLMLSGIGPADDLAALGIQPVVNLRGVGKNLQDHVLCAGLNYEAPMPLPPSNYNGSEVYMWSRSDSRLEAPDMVTLYCSVPICAASCPRDGISNGWCVLSGLSRPTSMGSIRLASANFADAPIIDPQYLATEHDRRVFSESAALAREIALHGAFAAHRAREVVPGDSVIKNSPDWLQFLARSANTFYHPTSTCKMGVDEMSVVDPQLRVYGIDGLRIADASIMPSITTSNTNAPSIMIGWKCAEMSRGAM